MQALPSHVSDSQRCSTFPPSRVFCLLPPPSAPSCSTLESASSLQTSEKFGTALCPPVPCSLGTQEGLKDWKDLTLSSATSHPLCLLLPTRSQAIFCFPATGQGPSTHQDQSGCHSPRSGNSAWPQPPSSCPETKDNMHESSPAGTRGALSQLFGTGTFIFVAT